MSVLRGGSRVATVAAEQMAGEEGARAYRGSSTDRASDTRRAVTDVRHLLWFRSAQVRRRPRRRPGSRPGSSLTTAAAAIVPALPAGRRRRRRPGVRPDPAAAVGVAGFLLLAAVSAAASGGGRELLPRDPAQIHPVSPTTDHLGALLLAPLNIAWLLQAWTLLGVDGVRPRHRQPAAPAQIVLLLWLSPPPPSAQVVAWSLEGVRRLSHGIAAVRLLLVALLGAALALQTTGHLVPLLDRIPTTWMVVGMGQRLVLALGAHRARRPGRAARRRRDRRRTGAPGRAAQPARRAATPRPAPAPARPMPRSPLAGADPQRPSVGVARRTHAARPGRARARPGGGRGARQPALELDDDPARAWSPPAARCCTASTPGASTPAARSGGRACRCRRARCSRPAPTSSRSSCWRRPWSPSPWARRGPACRRRPS